MDKVVLAQFSVQVLWVFPARHHSINVPEVCDRSDQPACYHNLGPHLGLHSHPVFTWTESGHCTL